MKIDTLVELVSTKPSSQDEAKNILCLANAELKSYIKHCPKYRSPNISFFHLLFEMRCGLHYKDFKDALECLKLLCTQYLSNMSQNEVTHLIKLLNEYLEV